MNNVPAQGALILAGVLFAIGAVGAMARRNLVFALISVEIMLTSAGLAMVAAGSKWRQPDGQVFLILIFVAAAIEVAVGLALALRVYHDWRTVDTDQVSLMREREPVEL